MIFLPRSDLATAGPGLYQITVHGYGADNDYTLAFEQTSSERRPLAEEQQVLEDIYTKCCYYNGCHFLKAFVRASDLGEPANFCHSKHQSCDKDGHITALRLPGHELDCEFPASIANLTHLERLDLEDNYVYGDVDTVFSTLKGLPLHSIHMSRNDLAGQLPCLPTEDEPLSALTYIDMSFNKIESTLPGCFFTPMQQIVTLEGNFLRGPFPEISGSVKMRHLDLSWQDEDDPLEGPLPDFTLWPNLEYLNVAENAISGPFPSLPLTIRTVRLHDNKIEGEVADLGAFKNLKMFDVQNNRLSGPLPGSLPVSLESLQMGQNLISGNIPGMEWFGHLEGPRGIQEIRLGGNALSGIIPPELGLLPQLWALNLTDNFLDGPLDIFVEGINNGNQIVQLEFANNKLSGPIPEDISNLKMLQGEYDPPSSRQRRQRPIFDLSGNILSGPIPVGLLKDAADEHRSLHFDVRNNMLECPLEYLNIFQGFGSEYARMSGFGATNCINRHGEVVLMSVDQDRLRNGDLVWDDELEDFVPRAAYPDEDTQPDEVLEGGDYEALWEEELIAGNDLDDGPEDLLTKAQEDEVLEKERLERMMKRGENDDEDDDEDGDSDDEFPWHVVIIVVASAVGIIIVALAIFLCVRCYRKKTGKAYKSYNDASSGIKTGVADLEQATLHDTSGYSTEPEITLAMAERVNAALDPEAQAPIDMTK